MTAPARCCSCGFKRTAKELCHADHNGKWCAMCWDAEEDTDAPPDETGGLSYEDETTE